MRATLLVGSSILIQIHRVARAQRTNWSRRHIPKKLCQHCGREEAVPYFFTIDRLRQHAAGCQSVRLRCASRRQKTQQVRGEWEKIRQENGQCRHLWCWCHHWQQYCERHFLVGSRCECFYGVVKKILGSERWCWLRWDMVTERVIGHTRLHGKGRFGNTELKFLSYLGIRSDDLYFSTKLHFSFVHVLGFGLTIEPIGILSYFTTPSTKF